MNRAQKFEMAAGATTFALGLLMPLRVMQFAGWTVFNVADWTFWVVPTVSLLVFLATIVDCYLTRVLTFVVLGLLCLLLVCVNGLFGFFLFLWGAPAAALLVFCPAIGAFMTVILAHR